MIAICPENSNSRGTFVESRIPEESIRSSQPHHLTDQMHLNSHRDFLSVERTLGARWSRRLAWLETTIQILAVGLIIMRLGFPGTEAAQATSLAVAVWLCMATLCGTATLRYRLTRNRLAYRLEHRSVIGVYLFWLAGTLPLLLFAPWSVDWPVFWGTRWDLIVHWSEFSLLLRVALGGAEGVRNLYVLGWSPALILVLSFVFLIGAGSVLLWLPAARVAGAELQSDYPTWLTAFYTSTSACCVTGLVIVDTGTYWSRTGQTIIMILIQIGGLGIMTFGAFVTLFSGRAMQVGEGVMFRDLFESDQIANVRRLVVSILVFTFGSELIGGVLLWGLWPELAVADRLFYCAFHSIAAFCNAGFALTPNNASFVGYGVYWQVWGVIAGLVIVGGLGFGVLHDTLFYFAALIHNWRQGSQLGCGPKPRAKLGVNAALVLLTTAGLLVGGTAALYFLDQGGAVGREQGFPAQISAAWFQSVIARTAGFNSIDIGAMQPAAKLTLIILMFIGASPVSTGGGVKTASFAIGGLAFWALMRGRERVEIWGRTIPDSTVKRAASIAGVGAIVVIVTTLLLTILEPRADQFLDLLFEATSAFGTVGLSTGISAKLTQASLLVIALTMFVGRVGPLTLFLAVVGREAVGRYQYPAEKITLG
jgi:trk system potassium uptake protein TrkH